MTLQLHHAMTPEELDSVFSVKSHSEGNQIVEQNTLF